MDTGEWGDLLQTFPLTSVHSVKSQSFASFLAGVRGVASQAKPILAIPLPLSPLPII